MSWSKCNIVRYPLWTTKKHLHIHKRKKNEWVSTHMEFTVCLSLLPPLTYPHHIYPCLWSVNIHTFRETKLFIVFMPSLVGIMNGFNFLFYMCLYFLNSPHWILTTILKHPRLHLNVLNSWHRVNGAKQRSIPLHKFIAIKLLYFLFPERSTLKISSSCSDCSALTVLPAPLLP